MNNVTQTPIRMPLWQRLFSKTRKEAFIITASLFISISSFAHSVTGYTGGCTTGPVYSLDAQVSNVNSSSNYAWQYKNASNVWVCIVNGSNTINGFTYSVSGATSTATTNPAPIVFNNPNGGLHGLVIRCVISDGSGVNPCNMPSGNTWNSGSGSVNHTISVNNTPCGTNTCTGRVTSLYFNKLDGGADIAITNGSAFTSAQLGSLYNFEAGTTGAVGSVKFTISGPTATTNIENATPYNSPGTGSGAWTGAPGAYSVNLKTYSAADGTGTLCHDTTISFTLTNDCNCPANLLTNGSFDTGTASPWSVSGGTLTFGTSYVMCGTKNGFLNHSSGTAKLWQDVTIAAGSGVNFKGYAGTHAPGLACSPKLSLIFLNASNAVISQVDVAVTHDVGSGNQLALYTLSATAPAGTVKVRVQGSITCNTLKVDGFCLTTTPAASLGDFVWQDLDSDGEQDAGEPGIPNVTVTLRNSSNVVVGTTTTNASGGYLFTGLVAGTYSVTFDTPAGYAPTPVVNSEIAGDALDSDPVAGVVAGIVVPAGTSNTTIDAGFVRLVNLSGHVWHDVNAMTDDLVNNTGPLQTPPALPIPANLIAYLVNPAGLVEQIAFVNPADGTYSFPNVTPNTTYYVLISTAFGILNVPPPAITLPSGWMHTGQQLGSPAVNGHDGLNDGRLVAPVGTTDVINVNFGIRKSGGDVVIG